MRVYYSYHPWVDGTKVIDYEEDKIAAFARRKIPDGQQEEVQVFHKYSYTSTPQEILDIMETCQMLVFSTVSGMISQFQYNDILCALNREKKVYMMYAGKFYAVGNTKEFSTKLIEDIVFDGDPEIYAVVQNMSSR